MKLLLLGATNVWAIDRYYERYLREWGETVELLPTFTVYLEQRNSSVFSKIADRLGISPIPRRIDALVRDKAAAFDPEVVLVFKGMEVMPETISWLREKGIFMVNYNPDNPFIFTDRGSGNRNVTDAIPLYHLHLTYDHTIREQLQSRGFKAALLPFGYEISEETYQISLRETEIVKTCFVGTPDTTRIAFIKELLALGLHIDIYGNDWDKHLQHPHATLHKAVYGVDFWKILRRYRVQLNLMRIHNQHSHNMRSFEVPGIGGIMVAPDTVEHRMYFEDGKEIFLYRTAADCHAAIEQVLDMAPDTARQVRDAARNRSETSGYSYRSRARQMIEEIRQAWTH